MPIKSGTRFQPHLIPKSEPVILHADFDAIQEAEDEAVREILAGHSFSAVTPGPGKPKT